MIEDFQPEQLIEAAHKAAASALRSVQAIADGDMIREEAKDYLAAIMTKIKSGIESKISETELERLARSSQEWQDFRIQQAEIQMDALKAKVEAQNDQRFFDAVQSFLSYRKEELKHHGS